MNTVFKFIIVDLFKPSDIEEQITDMIMKYIEKPNTLILAITPANTDFATSEAVKLARMVDPEGQRRVLKFCKSNNYFLLISTYKKIYIFISIYIYMLISL